jgi:hypothetical protein
MFFILDGFKVFIELNLKIQFVGLYHFPCFTEDDANFLKVYGRYHDLKSNKLPIAAIIIVLYPGAVDERLGILLNFSALHGQLYEMVAFFNVGRSVHKQYQ